MDDTMKKRVGFYVKKCLFLHCVIYFAIRGCFDSADGRLVKKVSHFFGFVTFQSLMQKDILWLTSEWKGRDICERKEKESKEKDVLER